LAEIESRILDASIKIAVTIYHFTSKYAARPMIFEQVVFFFLAAVAASSAVLMLLQRNPVNSALFLILNFFSLGGLYLILRAQFIAMVHIIVYAGAIMVLVLFVIMLLNLGDGRRLREVLTAKTAVGIGCSIAFFLELFYILGFKGRMPLRPFSPDAQHIGTVENLGKVLYTTYLFPFEITSLLLLAAIVGAVMLAKKKIPE
jgi:NADH-quinone oxidoreductase subunit J